MSDNYQYVPCGTCRGAKFMMKLGGMYGECNTCGGTGEVKELRRTSNNTMPIPIENGGTDIEQPDFDDGIVKIEAFEPPSKRLDKLKKDKAN